MFNLLGFTGFRKSYSKFRQLMLLNIMLIQSFLYILQKITLRIEYGERKISLGI